MTCLAQHFLTSRSIARRMVETAEVNPKDIVLEIGPGKGILTEELLKTGAKVIAVEKDIELFNFLNKKFETFILSNHLTLLNADIRDYLKPKNVSVRHRVFNKAVANIPYYLTGQLLRLLLDPLSKSYQLKAKSYVLMLQKEVAQRIIGHKMNLLAISVRVFAKPRIAFYVSKKYFRPKPKVDSAVIILERRRRDFFREHKISQKAFFELVKTGFRHPRKLLKNNLKISNLEGWIKCGIAPNARAEDLTLENWGCLVKGV